MNLSADNFSEKKLSGRVRYFDIRAYCSRPQVQLFFFFIAGRFTILINEYVGMIFVTNILTRSYFFCIFLQIVYV